MKRDTISNFNRKTVWLATGVLGAVVFAALVLAIQEYQPKAPQTKKGPFAESQCPWSGKRACE
jgi:hypothetical protein